MNTPQDKIDYAPLSDLQRLRSYSRRKSDGTREDWNETCDRTLYSPTLGLKVLGQFTDKEMALIDEMQRSKVAFGSARWLWVGGTEWINNPENYPGAYNCTSFRVVDIDTIANLMDLAMQGSGTGAVVELDAIDQLPEIKNKLWIRNINTHEYQKLAKANRLEFTEVNISEDNETVDIHIGDSRQGWVSAYKSLLQLATSDFFAGHIEVYINHASVRPKGEQLKGFGGTANPDRLAQSFTNVAKTLNKALNRKLNSVEVCLVIGEGAAAVVAGNIRRSAGMKQGSEGDELFATSKDNLWTQDEKGSWRIDPERDALRTSNHTRVFHRKPTEQECIDSVRKQFYSGEGAIQYAPEAIARANADILDTPKIKKEFLDKYSESIKRGRWVVVGGLVKTDQHGDSALECDRFNKEVDHRMKRYALNPCGEIISTDFFCNLASVHLNQIDPFDFEAQEKAFTASALQAAAFLNRGFTNPRYQHSRDLDPIVGVSFTGAFTFFVKAFGVDWLKWWQAGRPKHWGTDQQLWDLCDRCVVFEGYVGNFAYVSDAFEVLEQFYFRQWCATAHNTVWDYCDRHGIKRPNRCTTVKPEGSLTLLTGVGACGWHPPKAKHYIRRMTFGAHDPIALAAIDYGYNVVPSQSCKDEQGNLLDDPFDPRVTEWLVEVLVAEPWADLPGAEDIDPSAFPVEAQWDFYMQVQKHYTTHNCFARNTEFLTDKGVKTFESFNEGDSVTVLNANGDWVSAEVVATLGEREMIEITLREGKTGREKKIVSTLCHRFPVRRASGGNSMVKVLKASDLKIGHRLVVNTADLPDLDLQGIQHGIVFGDGSLYRNSSSGEHKGSQLYLCGAKRHLQSYFIEYERTHERDDIDQTRIYGLPVEWKTLPSSDCSQAYLAGFIAGLLATDGSVHRSTVSISTGRENVVNFLRSQAPRLGIKVTSWKWYESSSYKEGAGAFAVNFSKTTFPENLVLRPHHLEHYQSHESQPCQWRIVSLEKLEEKQKAWCVMEPETNHFTLSDNILVMNTSATIEIYESEIEALGKLIHGAIANDEGYISAAIMGRSDGNSTFPRLPFEPISAEKFAELREKMLEKRNTTVVDGVVDFMALIAKYDNPTIDASPQDAACDSGLCEIKGATPSKAQSKSGDIFKPVD